MAFIQYLAFDSMPLPLPDSYEVQMVDIEADSGGETEAGTTSGMWYGWGWRVFRSPFPYRQNGYGCLRGLSSGRRSAWTILIRRRWR